MKKEIKHQIKLILTDKKIDLIKILQVKNYKKVEDLQTSESFWGLG